MENILPPYLSNIASASANHLAVVQGEHRVSYGELWEKIDRCRIFFQSKISKGDHVALIVDNSIEYISAFYGVWLAGGVVVGLNTALKSKELARLVKHCDASCLVLGKTLNEEFYSYIELENYSILSLSKSSVGIDVTYINDILESSSDSLAPEYTELVASDLAMIIYTSGTTGHPKGVMLSHGNLTANILSITQYLGIEENDRVMCVLPFFYSYGNSILHSHLVKGATLYLENSFSYPHKVIASIDENKISAFYGVPSTYYLLLKRTKLENYSLKSLRYCAQAGGPMAKEKITEFRQRVPHARFFVMYGQTEASARLCYLPPEKLHQQGGSVGLPIPGVEISIQRQDGSSCRAGETGQVCARGQNVMMGYYKDKEETEKVLYQGWLHTGDLGYLNAEGFLYLVGRNSDLIKTGAYRVSPLEIEELLLSMPEIEELAVIGVPDDLLGQVIKAFVVLVQADFDKSEMKRKILRKCKEELPIFKMPKQLVFVSSLPKTASGKIKKHELYP